MNSKNMILKNIIDSETIVLGAAPQTSNIVRFAYTENSAAIASGKDGQLVFAHLEGLAGHTGVVYVGDKIVSSKILDASFVDVNIEGTGANAGKYLHTDGLYYTLNDESIPEGVEPAPKQTFSVKYVDSAASNAIVTASFDNVNPTLAQAFVKSQAAADAERLNRLDSSVSGIETFISNDVVTAADNASNAVVVTSTEGTNGYKTYTVDVKVDNETVKIDSNKVISAEKSLDISAGADTQVGKNFIVLKNAAGEIESAIDVADIVGDGIVSSTSYNPATNELTITWNTATGDTATVINLAEMLDINDVMVKVGSDDYLDVTADTSVISIGTKMQDISTADATHTGLLDASTTKTWILDQLSDTAIEVQGDDYIGASIDANNNKKINIDSSVENLTYTATVEGTSNATLVGVANSLVDGAQAATAISNFVNDRINASINALDAEQGGKGVNVSVGVTEVDGKITAVEVEETYATVTYAAPEGNNPASLVVTDETKDGLVTGNDINAVKQYVDAKFASGDADATVTEETTNYIHVTFAERDGLLSAADSSMTVVYADYANASAGIATDAYVTAAIQALDVAADTQDASAVDTLGLVKVTASETDGKIKMESVEVKTIDVSTATEDASGLVTAYAVKQALSWEIIS